MEAEKEWEPAVAFHSADNIFVSPAWSSNGSELVDVLSTANTKVPLSTEPLLLYRTVYMVIVSPEVTSIAESQTL